MISVFLGTFFTLLLLGVWTSVSVLTEGHVVTLARQEIEVTPKYKVGFLRVTKSEERAMDQEAIAQLSALSDVKKVIKERIASFPSSLQLDIFGANFETDSPVYGLEDEEFFSKTEVTKRDNMIPVLISQELMDVYNVGIAGVVHKPQLNEQALLHFPLSLLLGVSSFTKSDRSSAIVKPMEVVGVVSGISLVGVTLPLSEVEKLDETFSGKKSPPIYTRIKLVVGDEKNIPAIKAKVQALGFQAISQEDQSGPVRTQLRYVMGVMLFIVFTVLLLVLLNLFFLFFVYFESSHYLVALMKLFGASSRDLLWYFCLQFFLIVVPPALGGAGVAQLMLSIMELYVSQQFPGLFSTSVSLVLSLPLLIGALLFLLLFLFTAFVVPLGRALRRPIASVLASQ